MTEDTLIEEALAAARDTRFLRIGTNLLSESPLLFQQAFGEQSAVVVADSGMTAPPVPKIGQPLAPTQIALPDPAALKATGIVEPSSSPASTLYSDCFAMPSSGPHPRLFLSTLLSTHPKGRKSKVSIPIKSCQAAGDALPGGVPAALVGVHPVSALCDVSIETAETIGVFISTLWPVLMCR